MEHGSCRIASSGMIFLLYSPHFISVIYSFICHAGCITMDVFGNYQMLYEYDYDKINTLLQEAENYKKMCILLKVEKT